MGFAHRFQQDRFQIDLLVQGVVQYAAHRSDDFQQYLNGVRLRERRQLAVACHRFLAFVDQVGGIGQDRAELHRAHRFKQVVEQRFEIFPFPGQPRHD